MYNHAIVLAALSAGAFAAAPAISVYAIAYPPSDTTCTGTPAGNNVTLSVNMHLPPHGGDYYNSSCIPYAPEHGQLVKFEAYPDGPFFRIGIYSDANCQTSTGDLHPTSPDSPDNCMPMNGSTTADGSFDSSPVGTEDWKSVQLQVYDWVPA